MVPALGEIELRMPNGGLRLVCAAMLLMTGCATFGQRDPLPKDLAAGQSLKQQGIAAMERDEWEQAERILLRSIELSPDDVASRRHLAEVLWHRQATAVALEQIEAAVRLAPVDAALAVRSGEMLLASGNTEQALVRATEAIRHDAEFASAWALRGRIHWLRNETDRALADLQRALQYEPDNADVIMDLAAIYQQRGQHDRCLTTLHELLDVGPPGPQRQQALWMEGLALDKLGRPQQSAESLLAASQHGPPSADLLCTLAHAQWAIGQPDEAVASINEALAADASHEPSRRFRLQIAAEAPTQKLVR